MTRRDRTRLSLEGLSLATALLVLVQGGAEGADPTASPFKVKSVEGQTLELSALLQKGPVLLEFWATWCKPCLSSLPEIEQLHRAHAGDGLTVIGVSIDGPRNYSKVRPFAKRLGLTYAIALDEDGLLQSRYQVRAVPTSILISPDGTIANVTQGYRPGEVASLSAAVEALLEPEDGEKQ